MVLLSDGARTQIAAGDLTDDARIAAINDAGGTPVGDYVEWSDLKALFAKLGETNIFSGTNLFGGLSLFNGSFTVNEKFISNYDTASESTDQDDYELPDYWTIRFNPTANHAFTGFDASSSNARRATFLNASSTYFVTLKHQNAGSEAANRIICPNNIDAIMYPGAWCDAWYDSEDSRWRVAIFGNSSAIQTASYASSQTLTSIECYGYIIYVTGAGTITLPSVAPGMSVTIKTVGNIAVSVKPNASDLIYLDGVALDDGDKITNSSTAGDTTVLTYYGADGWYASTDGWTDGGA